MQNDTVSYPMGTVFGLQDVVEYQEGAIVSKQVIAKKTGTITIFAFDKGQGLSEHIAPFDAFVSIIEGEADITIDGKILRVHGGQCVILPQGKVHALASVTRFKMMLAMIKAHS